jgi:ferredoxin, 2Fe-2S
MTKIIYVDPRNAAQTVDLADGTSLMQGALASGVDGIVAECGGNAMCATCHVYIESERIADLPLMSEEENALLEGVAAPRKSNSRLSCQVKVHVGLERMTIYVAPAQ